LSRRKGGAIWRDELWLQNENEKEKCHDCRVCQMVYFQSKNPNSGKFSWALVSERLVCIFYGHLEYNTGNFYILWQFGIFSPVLVYFVKRNLATLTTR
jgi:hypothetical protein